MDAANRRPQLPALSYLDVGDLKREETKDSDRNLSQTAAAPSPTYQYPTGPPPPYNSHHAPPSTNGWSGTKSGIQTPPGGRRRVSGEETDGPRLSTRQSLPSLSEALGVDGHTPYPVAVPAQVPASRSPAPASPMSGPRRPFGAELSAPPGQYSSQPPQQYASFRQDSAGPQTYQSQEPARQPHEAISDTRAPVQLQTTNPRLAQAPSHAHPSTSSAHESSNATTNSMPPPPSTFSYGYTNSTPRYAQANAAPGQNNGPIYSPSAQYGPPPRTTTGWRADSSRYGPDGRSPQVYGESVKRHIDLYDIEASLTEIERSSGSLADFSRRYGAHMHQQARSGPTLSSLPSIVELDDMMAKSRLQLDSLAKIREVVVAQQAAFEQQAADQRQQHKVFTEPSPIPTGPSLDDDVKAGFVNGDTKKRRGRAAPPGRCHSCNRAETPEWRRGPDGARTLCNACGLHYAKLTRKNQSGAGKSSQAGSSTLRPKEQ